MPTYPDLMVLEVPLLKDEAVDALYTFLEDRFRQFEDHYGHQLRRLWREHEARSRDPLEPWKRVTPSAAEPEEPLDDELNDEIPF